MGKGGTVIPAITLGSYALPDFVRLNILQCRRIWPGCPILVSDDQSPYSRSVSDIADALGACYMVSGNRRTHVSGDYQAFINGAVFALQEGLPALKLSQRFVPRLPEFARRLTEDYRPPAVAVLPGRMRPTQIARPQSNFYLRFGHLTDCVLFDPKVITPEILLEEYQKGGEGHPSNLFSELAWERLRQRFPTVHRCDWLANQEPMVDKLYLRKACSNPAEYEALARTHGFSGSWNCTEWKRIEGDNYRSVPLKV